MVNLILNTLGVVCAVIIFWFLFRASLPKAPKDDQLEQIQMEDYLRKITEATGLSVYDTFRISSEEWRVSADIFERDFTRYLSSQKIPYYVKDFIRKGRKHIDEIYVGSGGFAINKKLTVYLSFLVLVFWGGAAILCVFVLPIILPENLANMHLTGPP